MKFNKKYFINVISFALFVVCAFHFIATWLYFFINPFVSEHLMGFSWIGILINLVELFYCIWFYEYYNQTVNGE